MIIIGTLLRLYIKNKWRKTIVVFLQIFYTLELQMEIYNLVQYKTLTRVKKSYY
jgi:hypothetical protein